MIHPITKVPINVGFNVFLVMKLTVILLTAALLEVSASAYSQGTKIDLSIEQQSFRHILKDIRKKSDFKFLYESKVINQLPKMSINVSDQTLEAILDQLIVDHGLEYEINDRTVVIRKAKYSMVPNEDQEIANIVTGTVTDASNGDPLPGVNIIIKGTLEGTVTEVNGTYSLDVAEDAVLLFSFIGYQTAEVVVGARSVVDVQLIVDVSQLDEVVVIGYGEVSKRELTGSISTVKSEDIAKQAVASFEQALAGRAAGVQVLQNSGAPGGSVSLRIRGVGTPGNSEPLYVIDGVPVFNSNRGRGLDRGQSSNALATINPKDIESIEILKDASSAAIYGSRAANGVVIITTKQGKPGALKFDVDFYGGVQTVAKKVDVLDGPTYSSFYQELTGTVPTNPANTDWFDELYGPAGIYEVQVSASGGNENSTMMFSTGYFKQDGIIQNSDFERFSLRFNSAHKVGSRFRFGNNATISRTLEHGQITDQIFNGGTSLVFMFPPVIPVRLPDGSYGQSEDAGITFPRINLIQQNEEVLHENQKFRFLGNVYGEFDILEGLTYRLNLGADFLYGGSKLFNPGISGGGLALPQIGEQFDSNELIWLVEHTLSYKRTFGEDHNFNLLAGFTKQESQYENHFGSKQGFISNELIYLSAGTTADVAEGAGVAWGLQSTFGRLTYNYRGKYLFTASVRRDGSSKFAPGNKYGTFPAASAGWRISDEDFFNSGFIGDLKIRGSWGQLGNQEIAPFQYLSLMATNGGYIFGSNQQFVTGIYPRNLANPNITWETTEQLDLGIDLGLFDNKMSFSFNYYNRETSDILLDTPIPTNYGFRTNFNNITPVVNAGVVENTGIELELGYKQNTGKAQWSINGNLTTLHNEVTSLGGGEPLFAGSAQDFQTITEVGGPIGAFYGYVMEGIFQDQADIDNSATQSGAVPGDIKFSDLDGNGMIDDADRKVIGSAIPDLMVGLQGELQISNFDFSFSMQGNFGQEVFANTLIRVGDFSQPDNKYQILYDQRWTGPGTSNTVPRIGAESNNNLRPSTYSVYDGSFLRMNNIQLGYTLPVETLSSLGVSSLRVYFNVQNLFTIDDYDIGLNPDIGAINQNNLVIGRDSGVYPVPRTFMAGINVSF